MNAQNLKFGGYYLAEKKDFESAKVAIDRELSERAPDKDSPGGYLPDYQFTKAANKFSDDFSIFSVEMRQKAASGEEITPKELEVLERGELLHCRAMSVSLAQADMRSGFLRAGKNFSSPDSSSITETVRRQMKAPESRGPSGLGTFSFRL